MQGFISPLIQIRFVLETEGLQIYDNQENRFLTYLELSQKMKP